MALDVSKAQMNQYRLHAVTALTGPATFMSQMTELSAYSPVAAALAFVLSASSYKDAFSRADKLIDALEEAEVIDEEVADAVNEVADAAENIA